MPDESTVVSLQQITVSLSSEDAGVRMTAIATLEEVGVKASEGGIWGRVFEVTSMVTPLMCDSDGRVQQKAAEVMRRLQEITERSLPKGFEARVFTRIARQNMTPIADARTPANQTGTRAKEKLPR